MEVAGGYCIGDRVELHSLKGAAEHNEKRGTVTAPKNERIKVKLDGDKSLALKPANLRRLEPPLPTKPAVSTREVGAAKVADFFAEAKQQEETKEEDPELLVMEQNIKEYKAQEKKRNIRAAKARAAKQEKARKAKILEKQQQQEQAEAAEVWVDGARVDTNQEAPSEEEEEEEVVVETKKKGFWSWGGGAADEDVALTADELAFAGDFGTDEEARVQRRLTPKRPRPSSTEEAQSAALAVQDCPVPREDPDGAIKFLSRKLRRDRSVSLSCRAWFAVHELLAASFLRLEEQSVVVLKSALYHDERCLEGVASAGLGPLDAERPRIECRASQTCGTLAEVLKRKGLPPAQRRQLAQKECELAELAVENARYVEDDELAKVARLSALDLKGTAYLRRCRLEQADCDAGEARLPPSSFTALEHAVEALDEACRDFATADGDALARLGASLEAKAVAARDPDIDAVDLRRALEALGAACDSSCRTGPKKQVAAFTASTALYAARVAFHLLNTETEDRKVSFLCREARERAARSRELVPSLEADYLEAAGFLREPSADHVNWTAARKALERARSALAFERKSEMPKGKLRTQDAERALKRGDREAVQRLKDINSAVKGRHATLYRETERALGHVSAKLGDRKFAVDCWERACAGVDASCRSELKKRPDAAACTNLELGAMRSLADDRRGAAEAYERACEAAQRVAALAARAHHSLNYAGAEARAQRALELCTQAFNAGVDNTLSAIKAEYAKCKWKYDEGSWLKCRGNADALLLLRLAEGKRAAERAVHLGSCVESLVGKGALDEPTQNALRDLDIDIRKTTQAAQPALVASKPVCANPAPPRLELVASIGLVELATGPLLLQRTASLVEADADVEPCSRCLERLAHAPHLAVQLSCGPRDSRADLEAILTEATDVLVAFFVSNEQLVGVAFGDKLRTARLFVRPWDARAMEAAVEVTLRGRGLTARKAAAKLAAMFALDELRDAFPKATDVAFCVGPGLPKIPFHALPLANGASLLDSVVVRYGSSVAELAAVERRGKPGGTLLATVAQASNEPEETLEHGIVRTCWRLACVPVPAKAVPAMLMACDDVSEAGADLLDANCVYWSTARLDGSGLKLGDHTFPSNHLASIKEVVPACDCLFLLRSTGDVSKTNELGSALHMAGTSSIVLPAPQAALLSGEGPTACFLRSLVMMAFLKYLRGHERTSRSVAHALRDAQRWLRDATLQDARSLLQSAPIDPTEKRDLASGLMKAWPELDRKLAPDLCDWAGFYLMGSGRGLRGAGWAAREAGYALGGDASSDSDASDMDAEDRYFAEQFDAFCSTREGRRLVRELGPEKALRQWKQKVARDSRAAATGKALAGARANTSKALAGARAKTAKARMAARRAKDKAALVGRAMAEEKDKSGACVCS